jgi:DNA-binding MarR family transcriptional regulator
VALNLNAGAGRRRGRRASRRATLKDLLDEMTSWGPRERAGAFKHWLRGSLSLVHLHVLTVLQVHGPLPMSKLADELDVSVASLTGIIDRMEARGLVERRREPDDRRVIVVHRTDAGDAVFGEMAAQRRKHLEALFDRMTHEELESFLVGLRALRRVRSESMAESDREDASA